MYATAAATDARLCITPALDHQGVYTRARAQEWLITFGHNSCGQRSLARKIDADAIIINNFFFIYIYISFFPRRVHAGEDVSYAVVRVY